MCVCLFSLSWPSRRQYGLHLCIFGLVIWHEGIFTELQETAVSYRRIQEPVTGKIIHLYDLYAINGPQWTACLAKGYYTEKAVYVGRTSSDGKQQKTLGDDVLHSKRTA